MSFERSVEVKKRREDVQETEGEHDKEEAAQGFMLRGGQGGSWAP